MLETLTAFHDLLVSHSSVATLKTEDAPVAVVIRTKDSVKEFITTIENAISESEACSNGVVIKSATPLDYGFVVDLDVDLDMGEDEPEARTITLSAANIY
jgi:hypothetical protein